MSDIKCYGSLLDPRVKECLDIALKSPEVWSIYLVYGNSNQRTLSQNRLYHSLIGKIAQTLGGDVKYWKLTLEEKFLGHEDVLTEDGYAIRVLRSTSDLTVVQFSEFLNACISWAGEKGVN